MKNTGRKGVSVNTISCGNGDAKCHPQQSLLLQASLVLSLMKFLSYFFTLKIYLFSIIRIQYSLYGRYENFTAQSSTTLAKHISLKFLSSVSFFEFFHVIPCRVFKIYYFSILKIFLIYFKILN